MCYGHDDSHTLRVSRLAQKVSPKGGMAVAIAEVAVALAPAMLLLGDGEGMVVLVTRVACMQL